MYYNATMSSAFESEKNRKATLYTAIICGIILLLIFFITWPLYKLPPPLAQDLIEINLGNDAEGFGETQPLIKGQMSPSQDQPSPEQAVATAAKEEPAKDMTDDNADKDAAPIDKPVKPVVANNIPKPTTQPVKTNNPTSAAIPTPKPPKPKITYNGPGTGNGNNATEDNGYRMQGNNPNGKGDAGNPNGKPDSYGNNPGGKTGGSGLRVSKGDRRIVNNYIFMGDLPKAIINAIIKVSPDGRGSFVKIDKGSTSSDSRYISAIISYLPNIKFDKADHESIVTVPFNFNVL